MKRKPDPEAERRREIEERRIANQRNLFTFLPVVPAVESLKTAMLQRAYDLLTDGDAEACDAITEFLPSRDVEEMLDAWLDDQAERAVKSRWYGA